MLSPTFHVAYLRGLIVNGYEDRGPELQELQRIAAENEDWRRWSSIADVVTNVSTAVLGFAAVILSAILLSNDVSPKMPELLVASMATIFGVLTTAVFGKMILASQRGQRKKWAKGGLMLSAVGMAAGLGLLISFAWINLLG